MDSNVVILPVSLAQDSTPFSFQEDRWAIDYFGEQLRAAGYNYYGSEPLYRYVCCVEATYEVDLPTGAVIILACHARLLWCVLR
jgi:hypothetical protein